MTLLRNLEKLNRLEFVGALLICGLVVSFLQYLFGFILPQSVSSGAPFEAFLATIIAGFFGVAFSGRFADAGLPRHIGLLPSAFVLTIALVFLLGDSSTGASQAMITFSQLGIFILFLCALLAPPKKS